MAIVNFSRRAILVIPAIILSPLAMLTSCAPSNSKAEKSAEDEGRLKVLQRFVELLFPIEGVGTSSFTDVAKGLLNNPDLTEPIEIGIDALNRAVEANWQAKEGPTQIQAMTFLEKEPWFITLFIMSRAALFDHPQVWSVLDYEGPSTEFGGYKGRGFDDIDWLPEVTQ